MNFIARNYNLLGTVASASKASTTGTGESLDKANQVEFSDQIQLNLQRSLRAVTDNNIAGETPYEFVSGNVKGELGRSSGNKLFEQVTSSTGTLIIIRVHTLFLIESKPHKRFRDVVAKRTKIL